MARHRVQVLRSAALPQARIATIEGISERSVRAICGEAPIEDPRDVAQAHERGVGRPSVVEACRDRVAAPSDSASAPRDSAAAAGEGR